MKTQRLLFQLGASAVEHAHLSVQRQHLCGHADVHLQLANAVQQAQGKYHIGVDLGIAGEPA